MTRNALRNLSFTLAWLLPAVVVWPAAARAQHQTSTFFPIELNPSLPFKIQLKEYDFGSAELPGLHSYAAGHYDGKWVLIAGRTNGVHDLDQSGEGSFPEESQNRDVWVIDPVAKQSWHRSLGDPANAGVDPSSGLTAAQITSLTPTNNEFTQQGNRLYMAGGYGLNTAGTFTTFDVLTSIDLPGLVNWVQTGSGTAASHIRQIDSATASVTGGAMYEMGGRYHLVFGQDFEGDYSPRTDGSYTRQVRSFDIVDDGTNLAIANVTQTAPVSAYRRRDLNVVPIVEPDGAGGTREGLVALSGVFTSSFGAWTVPVEIDANGTPTMANPALADTFKQGFNGYHSAKLGLYSEAAGSMHEVLMGGISVQYLDESTGMVTTDNNMPFVNDVTAVTIDAAGKYSQQHLGFYPELLDDAGMRWRFGANAEFFAADGVQAFDNGVIKLDALASGARLGYVFGGIMSNGPHTRGFPDVTSTASFRIFEVVYKQVPEPAAWQMLALVGLFGAAVREPRGQVRQQVVGTE
ncbi:MAG: hypothetical protein AB7G28_12660 [Pirellulales bacterium]